MSKLTPELLSTFDRILTQAEKDVVESTEFLNSPEGRRQMRKYAHFPRAPIAVSIGEAEVRALRHIYNALAASSL